MLDWVVTHLRTVLWLGGIVLFLIITYSFVSQNAALVIEPIGTASGQKITTFISTDAETRRVGKSGLIIIPRSTKSLIVTGDNNRKTQIPLDIPWYGYVTKTVDFSPDKNADKIAFNSTFGSNTCVTYSPRLQNLLSYNCSNPVTLLQFQTPTSGAWRNVAVAKSLYYPEVVKPYLGGVIGLSISRVDDDINTTSPLVFTSDTGTAILYDLPEGIDLDTLGEANIFTNQRDPNDSRFILTTTDGSVYLGTPGSKKGSVTYAKFASPIDFASKPHQTICRIVENDVYCYRGQTANGEEATQSKTDDVISHYSFDSNRDETTKISKPTTMENLFVTDSGELYAKQFKKLLQLKREGSEYIATEIAQNIDSASAGSGLYYVQQGDVFQITPTGTANLVFHSDNITVKSVFVADSRVYMLGIINDSGDTSLHAYVINGQDNTTPGKRLIDLLPTASNQLPYTVSQNLSGNTLQIGLIVAFSRSPSETGTSASEINTRKQTVLNALTNRGINMNDLTVQFTY